MRQLDSEAMRGLSSDKCAALLTLIEGWTSEELEEARDALASKLENCRRAGDDGDRTQSAAVNRASDSPMLTKGE